MTTATRATPTVHRIEVHPLPGAGDPLGERIVREASALGYAITIARTARVYLVEGDLDDTMLERLIAALLVNPVTERGVVGASGAGAGVTVIEVHPLPGVMDPAAGTVRDAIRDLLGVEAGVSTGVRYEFEGIDPAGAESLAGRLLANPVVQAVHTGPHHPRALPKGHEQASPVVHVPIRDLDDDALEWLSREAHLFLSPDEMRAIRDEYRRLEREPTDIELETLAQTWSEHCVHKTLKSTITYRGPGGPDPIDWTGRPGHTVNPDGSVTIDNLLRSTVAAATHELIAEGLDWTLSVFVDNAGVIAFDDEHAVNVKVETHNHPSAIEPYGGAATGIGGCIRDVIATGMGARPIANTDVFCVAPPGTADVPAGCLHPRRVLSQVVAGVRDYGNRMGIPTVNGAVWFDERYVGNPLVYCGCVGVMPRGEGDSMIRGAAHPGDRVVALGGRTGRDGIHGATFSSAELTDTHADEFAHAVQIGNAIEEKRVLDAVIRARDAAGGPLYHAITDCGAGGFSSAVGEMGEALGAEVHLDRAPLKYAGLTHTEIWISEAQERMVLAVPPDRMEALRRICDEEHVELADLGHFGTPGRELILNHRGVEVGRLPMGFLHDGIPMPTREAVWEPTRGTGATPNTQGGTGGTPVIAATPGIKDALLRLLAHPNIASKHWIIRQYDHEVQGNTIVRPLGGPMQRGPMDAAVVEPVPGSGRGLAIACGLATGLEADPYLMALAAIDECVRNLVCVGADPDRIAILDNFCWPSCKKPGNLASLVRAAEGCYDGAKAYRTPFISGKDSLNNQFTTEDGWTIEIPPTLLITGVGIVHDIEKCVTMDGKRAGSVLLLVGPRGDGGLGGSHFERLFGGDGGPIPALDLGAGPAAARVVAGAVARGLVESAHDVSDGGLLCALAEMLIGGSTPATPIGARLALEGLGADPLLTAFGEGPSRYLLEVNPADVDAIGSLCRETGVGVDATPVGELTDSGRLEIAGHDGIDVEDLARAWLGPLDW